MATNSIVPASIAPSVTSAVTSTTSAAPSAIGIDKNTLAGNFQTFLTLLTTQLKNQNPLDPLDTNQFTAQLVQFAQVEQQLKSNEQLGALVSLQQTAQNTAALGFIGQKVGVAGSSATLSDGKATWHLDVPKPAVGAIKITSASGQTVYTANYSMSAGNQPFVWDGKDASGLQWPNGNYTISITAQDAGGKPVAIPTEIEATVDSADLTKNPPVLSIAGQNYTLDKIKRVLRNSN